MFHDQTRATLARTIRPDPLHKHADTKTGLSKKLQMNRGPDQPCKEAAHMNLAALQNSEALPDHRKIPFVEVAKRSGGDPCL